MERLRRAMEQPVSPEEDEGLPPASDRVIRDADGKLPKKPPSPIRDAILAELGRRHMTRYQLWKAARETCSQLPESAVYEFLRGQRQIGVEYIEAMLGALELEIVSASGK
jgi:hypothetical protein